MYKFMKSILKASINFEIFDQESTHEYRAKTKSSKF